MRCGVKKPIRGLKNNRILTPVQVAFLKKFATSNLRELFRLTGGTALSAFYLEHRISEDLDFFSSERVPFYIIEKSLKAIDIASETTYTRQFDRNIFNLKSRNNSILKVEFTYYPLKSIEGTHLIEGLRIESFLDILVNKLCAIADRIDAKDYVDVYWGLKRSRLSLEHLIGLAEKKCEVKGIRFILKRRLLDIPEGVNNLLLKMETKKEEIESFFGKLVKKMVQKEV